MNDDQLKQLKNELSQTRLTKEEKASMRANIMRFADEHPIAPQAPAVSPYVFSSWVRVRTPVMALCAVLLLAGGGMSAAARTALPGDLLYPMKVEVNERVEAALALSSEAKAQVEARQAFRRLDEVEQLADRGSLTDETNATLRARFEEKADALDKRLAALDESGNPDTAAEVHAKVEAGLDARFNALVSISATKTSATTSRPRITNILNTLFERHEAARAEKEREDKQKEKENKREDRKETGKRESTKRAGPAAGVAATTTTDIATSSRHDTSGEERDRRGDEEDRGIFKKLEEFLKQSDNSTSTEAIAGAAASVSAVVSATTEAAASVVSAPAPAPAPSTAAPAPPSLPLGL